MARKSNLQEVLNRLANGADEVSYNGRVYRRSGPKNAVSQPGKWRAVKAEVL